MSHEIDYDKLGKAIGEGFAAGQTKAMQDLGPMIVTKVSEMMALSRQHEAGLFVEIPREVLAQRLVQKAQKLRNEATQIADTATVPYLKLSFMDRVRAENMCGYVNCCSLPEGAAEEIDKHREQQKVHTIERMRENADRFAFLANHLPAEQAMVRLSQYEADQLLFVDTVGYVPTTVMGYDPIKH